MVRWEDAKVHVMSHALHYGTSVFEGIRCYDSHKGPVVFRHREHMQRLHDSAKIYRFPVSQSVDELMEACREVIRQNKLTSAYIRPLVFVGDVGMGVNPPAGYNTDVIIAAFPWGAYRARKHWIRGSTQWFLPRNRVAPNTIPTAAKAGGNYLSSLLVGSEARRHGYREGIALDVNGYISEGAGENLFEVKDGILFTPPFTSSALPGITRDAIIKLAKDLGIEVREQVLSRESLYRLTKCSCPVPRLKLHRCVASTAFRWAKAAVVRSPNAFSKPSSACSPAKQKTNTAGWIRLITKYKFGTARTVPFNSQTGVNKACLSIVQPPPPTAVIWRVPAHCGAPPE